MDYKEKILTELSHVVRQFQERNVKEYMVKKIEEQMKDFINSLPSEKEIAKGVIEEYKAYLKENYSERIYPEFNSLENWLDKEAE